MTILALLFALTLAHAGTNDYLIPEAAPGSGDYNRVRTWIDLAASHGHADASMYQRIQRYNVQLESAVVDNRVALNPLQMPMEINGQRYWIPLELNSVDNYASLQSKPNGIYFVQRGFRMNTNRDLIDRVDISIRVADGNGNVLQNLEYHEVTRPSHY